MPVCRDSVCQNPPATDSKFAASICKQVRGSIHVAADFAGFVGSGDIWSGPYFDSQHRTYYAKHVDTKAGIPDTSYILQGVRYRLRSKELSDNSRAPSSTWQEDPGYGSSRKLALESLPSLTNLDYPMDPVHYLNLFTTFDRLHPSGGRYPGASFNTEKAPEANQPPKKVWGNWPQFSPFDSHTLDRIRLTINGKVAYDTDDFRGDPFVTYDLSQTEPRVIGVEIMEYDAAGKIQRKGVQIAATDEVFVDVWMKLSLKSRAPWTEGRPYYEHTFRVYTDETPILDFSVEAMGTYLGITKPGLIGMLGSMAMTGGASVQLVGKYQTSTVAPPLIIGFPVTPLFTPVIDTYQLTFDRVGDLVLPSMPLILSEKLGNGWELTEYERGVMTATGPQTNGYPNKISLNWASGNPFIRVDTYSNALRRGVWALYIPADNALWARYVKVQTAAFGEQVFDYGPSGTFDWRGETTFEIVAMSDNPPFTTSDGSRGRRYYPALKSYDFKANVPAYLPLTIKTKYLPGYFLPKP